MSIMKAMLIILAAWAAPLNRNIVRELALARSAVVLTVGAYAVALAPDARETSFRNRNGSTNHGWEVL